MHRWADHTSEVELEIEAPTERDVLVEALLALGELLGVEPTGLEPAERTVVAAAPDRPALLAAWLEELAFLAESEGFVATHAERLELAAHEVRATVSGVIDDPPPLVKAVTYHRLMFEASDAGYLARVVLDV